MAGKSGRTINHIPENPVKKLLLSWEGVLVLVFIGVNIFCACFSEYYTLSNVLRQMPVYIAEAFLMLAMGYILVLGEIDISVGSTVCLTATIACLASNAGMSLPVVFIIALALGTVCGMINGLILTVFDELPPMIVTLSTQIIFRGIAELVLGDGGSVSAENSDDFKLLATKIPVGDAFKVPIILIVLIILAVIFAVILGKTTFGRSVYAIGTNRLTAYYSGIPVNPIRFIIYSVMGTLCGLCGMFMVSCSYGANTTTGENFEMDAIAMAVFGGIMSTGGKGNIAGGVISAFAIVCLRIGLGVRNVNAQVILLIIGLLLVGTVAIPNIISNIKRAMKVKKAK